MIITNNLVESAILVIVAGVIGGIINALLADNKEVNLTVKGPNMPLRLGIFGNILIGAVAAFLTWALYGSAKDFVILGPGTNDQITLLLSDLAGGIIAGAGGTRIITAEIDKRFLRSAAYTAAAKTSTDKAAEIERSNPYKALEIAKTL